jgi:hypothetical protein
MVYLTKYGTHIHGFIAPIIINWMFAENIRNYGNLNRITFVYCSRINMNEAVSASEAEGS